MSKFYQKIDQHWFLNYEYIIPDIQKCIYFCGNISGGNYNFRENPCKPQQNSRLNSPKKSHV